MMNKQGLTFYALFTHCVYELCVNLGTKSDYFPTLQQLISFKGAFAKLRKTNSNITTSVCLSVCLSIRQEQLGSHWTNFHVI
jgi:hypothetical protein